MASKKQVLKYLLFLYLYTISELLYIKDPQCQPSILQCHDI